MYTAKLDSSILFADCSTDISQMLTVQPAALQPQYNTFGELVCTNGGVLFSNNKSVSTETMCNVTAQWIIPDNANCYTGIRTKYYCSAFVRLFHY